MKLYDPYPFITYNGSKHYWNDKGLMHREDGPALDTKEVKAWCINGQYHRIDGPAIEIINFAPTWFYYGERINCQTQEEFERMIKLRAFL